MIFKKLIFRTKKTTSSLSTPFNVNLLGNICNPNSSTVFETTLYHNGVLASPQIGDNIYYDFEQTSLAINISGVYFIGTKNGFATNVNGVSIVYYCE